MNQRRSLRVQGDVPLPSQRYYDFSTRNSTFIFERAINNPGALIGFACYVTLGVEGRTKKIKVGHFIGLQYIPDMNVLIWWESNSGVPRKEYGDYFKFYKSLRSQALRRGIEFVMSADYFPAQHARFVDLAQNRYMCGRAGGGYCAGYIEAMINNGFTLLHDQYN